MPTSRTRTLSRLIAWHLLVVWGIIPLHDGSGAAWPAREHRNAGWSDGSRCAQFSVQPRTPAVQTYHLALDGNHYLAVPVRVVAEDLVLQLDQGAGFVAFAGPRPTAIVLVGRGTVRFSPPIRSEQRQLCLWTGAPALTGVFETAYVRLHPDTFDSDVQPATLHDGTPEGSLLRRAQGIFNGNVGRSFAAETLEPAGRTGPVALLPSPGDFLAEIFTRRDGHLAYVRLAGEPEDITLLDRDHERRIVVYPSIAHRAACGFAYGDEYGLPYEVSHYDIEASIDPERLTMAGRTGLDVRAVETLETVRLRLDHGLAVNEVRSAEQGAHQFLQQPASDTLLVRLVPPLAAGQQVRLDVTYRGSAKPQALGRAAAGEASASRAPGTAGVLPPSDDASIIYSNHVYWFPQSPVRNHTTATLRIRVPSGYTVLASAAPAESSPIGGPAGTQTFAFRAESPARYLAVLVGKLTPVDRESPVKSRFVHGMASSRLLPVARASMREAADIIAYFNSLVGDTPFQPLTFAFIDTPLPSAHSPAYLAIVGQPPDWNPATAGDDPAYFAGEPQFFLAHEIAHQWWGQGVGWRNYREQWLSEAFAQYFAALYVRHARGEEAFVRVLAWMQRWARSVAGKGPINLGIRAGQIAGGTEDFVAIVYDRGACVLHMLRGLLGDDVFFRALRVYYDRWKFRRAGTDDFKQVLEETSGLDLERFFEQWVRDDGEPDVRWSATLAPQGDRPRLNVKFEQIGDVFDLPLQVSIDYEDRPSTTERLRLSLARQEHVFDLSGRFRRVRLNADLGALCELREQR